MSPRRLGSDDAGHRSYRLDRHGEVDRGRAFRSRGRPVFDADACVHRLYEGEAVPAIEAAFPGVRGGKVDRTLLAQELAGSPEKPEAARSIVHPMVVEAEIDF